MWRHGRAPFGEMLAVRGRSLAAKLVGKAASSGVVATARVDAAHRSSRFGTMRWRPTAGGHRSFSGGDANAKGGFKFAWIGMGATAAAGGVAYAGMRFYGITMADIFPEEREVVEIPPELKIPLPPLGDNLHPMESTPWWFRWYVTVKRAIHLITVFVPFGFVSVAVTIFDKDEGLREYWLGMMVRSLERAGCSFMKFGQWLSMRPDLFPADVIDALSKLRNDAPSHSLEHTRQSILQSFGKEVEEIFEYFEVDPVASGTIAQVYKATLREEFAMEGGVREVAVKVRHPHVVQESYIDTRLLFEVLDFMGEMLLSTAQPFDKNAFNTALQKQVDLKWEAYNLQLFARNFHGETDIKFPAVSAGLVSDCVMIESWINGKVVQEIFTELGAGFIAVERKAEDAIHAFSEEMVATKKKLAKVVLDMNMKMFLRDNYVHGDLHGGNLMLSHDGSLAVFDAGLTCRLAPEIAQPFGYLLQALCTGNTDRVVDKLCFFSQNIDESKVDMESFRSDMHQLMLDYVDQKSMNSPDGRPINMGVMVGAMLQCMQKHKLQLRGDVALTIMTMAISESLIRQLDPDFDLVRSTVPYFVRFRSWKPQQADLHSESWQTEREAINSGLPTGADYAEKALRQVTTLDAGASAGKSATV